MTLTKEIRAGQVALEHQLLLEKKCIQKATSLVNAKTFKTAMDGVNNRISVVPEKNESLGSNQKSDKFLKNE